MAHGSDTQQGPDWWRASDGRWYPPETHPDYAAGAGAATPDAAMTQRISASDAAAAIEEAAAPVAPSPVAPAPVVPPPAAAPPPVVPSVPAPAPVAAPPLAPPPAAAPPTAVAPAPAAGGWSPPPPPGGAPAPSPVGSPSPFEPLGAASAPAPAAAKATSMVAGIIAALGGLLCIIGSFLPWARNKGELDQLDRFDVTVAGLDSSGPWTLVLGILLLVVAALFILGVPTGWWWAIAAVVCGGLAICAVVFSFVDITGNFSDRLAEAVSESSGVDLDEVTDAGVGAKTSIGLWIAGLGGLIGALSAPFVRRA